jgi:hypothetical protein
LFEARHSPRYKPIRRRDDLIVAPDCRHQDVLILLAADCAATFSESLR